MNVATVTTVLPAPGPSMPTIAGGDFGALVDLAGGTDGDRAGNAPFPGTARLPVLAGPWPVPDAMATIETASQTAPSEASPGKSGDATPTPSTMAVRGTGRPADPVAAKAAEATLTRPAWPTPAAQRPLSSADPLPATQVDTSAPQIEAVEDGRSVTTPVPPTLASRDLLPAPTAGTQTEAKPGAVLARADDQGAAPTAVPADTREPGPMPASTDMPEAASTPAPMDMPEAGPTPAPTDIREAALAPAPTDTRRTAPTRAMTPPHPSARASTPPELPVADPGGRPMEGEAVVAVTPRPSGSKTKSRTDADTPPDPASMPSVAAIQPDPGAQALTVAVRVPTVPVTKIPAPDTGGSDRRDASLAASVPTSPGETQRGDPATQGPAPTPTRASHGDGFDPAPFPLQGTATATNAAPQAAEATPVTVAAQPGRIGRETGIQIARHAAAGASAVTVRLDPAGMGRIDVRLSFDDTGRLHAAVHADNPAALDLLRREAGDLGRALADAGIAADASAFSFDSHAGGGFGEPGRQQPRQPRPDTRYAAGRPDADRTPFRPLRTSDRIDLIA